VARRDAATAHKVAPSMRGTLEGGWALLRGAGVVYDTFD
jgi:hypothetical protein